MKHVMSIKEARKGFLEMFGYDPFGYDTFEEIYCHNQIDNTKKELEVYKEYPNYLLLEGSRRDHQRLLHKLEYWTDRLNGVANQQWDLNGYPWKP